MTKLLLLVVTLWAGSAAATQPAFINAPNMDPDRYSSHRVAPSVPGTPPVVPHSGGPNPEWTRQSGRETGTNQEIGGWNEACVVVNPNDPMNVAYASLMELRVSMDGGATWQPSVFPQLPPGSFPDGDTNLAFDGQGRLFWSYLAVPPNSAGVDIYISQCDPATGSVLPGYPVDVTSQVGLSGRSNDKEWLAADSHPGSPFGNRLYLVWTLLGTTNNTMVTHSTDHGQTWSPVVNLLGQGFTWPAHIAVGPNGYVYVADHVQTGFGPNGGEPDGISGRVRFFRSTDGGASFAGSLAFTAGNADITWNVYSVPPTIPNTDFWTQGSIQPWILPDPSIAGRVYVVANDDPDNDPGSGDAANVYLATSSDYGATWGAPIRVDHGPDDSFQVMPAASIDPVSGAIVVTYYDNRIGALNTQGNYLLDLYAAVSIDRGATFRDDFQVNDLPFDPDAGSRCRWDCGGFIRDVWAGTDGKAFAVANTGEFLAYDGSGWGVVQPGNTIRKHGIWGSANNDVYACGNNGLILHYDGSGLTQQTSHTNRNLYSIDGRSGSDIFAVGAAGAVIHYDGIQWTPLTSGTTEVLAGIWVNPTGSAFAVGSGDTVLRFDGSSWTAIPTGSGDWLTGVWGFADDDVYTSDQRGHLYHWNGMAWSAITTGVPIVNAIWGASPASLVAVGFGTIRLYDGNNWGSQDGTEELLERLDGRGPNNIFVVGEDGTILHYDGASWTRQANPLESTISTKRIGEYNGIVAVGSGQSRAVWCGNTFIGPQLADFNPLDQQTVTASIETDPTMGLVVFDPDHTPAALNLEVPRPNPARHEATVAFTLPRAGMVDLSIINVQGRKVATLLQGNQLPGRHVVSWDGHSVKGVGGGDVLFLRLNAGGETATQKLVLAW